MRTLVFVAAALIGLGGAASGQTVTAAVLDGGTVQTDLAFNIKVNAGSTLKRSWVVLNDSTAPVRLDGTGVSAQYIERPSGYQLKPIGKIVPSAAITAFEVRFLLFDIFGNHIKTLSGTEVRDLVPGKEFSLSEIGAWRAFENEVAKFFTIVSFVAHVRTADGKVWRYTEKAIGAELTRIQLQVKSGVLDPTAQP